MNDELNKNTIPDTTTQDPELLAEKTSSSEKEHHHHSSHHHHGHRSHSHHHHSSSSRRKRKIKRFFRKNKHKLLNIAVCFCIVAALIFFSFWLDGFSHSGDEDQGDINLTKSTIQIETSFYTEEVSLVDDAILTYISPENTLSANAVYRANDGYANNLNEGRPLEYAYEVVGLPTSLSVQGGQLLLSENSDFSDAEEISVVGHSQKIDIYNLKTGTKYYYRLNLEISNGSTLGTTGDFVTKTSPRILKVDGIKNVRDIGGWKTVDGKTLKQGLLYRGTELDGAVESTYRLSTAGLTEMVDGFGIRFDMDLRAPSVNINKTDALGTNIPHKYYNIQYYSEVLKQENQEAVRRVFADLANKDNYPVYLHCTYGRDRTGTICYLLEGLLGVSKEDAYKDYELTAFTDSYISEEEFKTFQENIDNLKGNTFQDKVEGYLLSIGVTSGEIQNIREIFLGE